MFALQPFIEFQGIHCEDILVISSLLDVTPQVLHAELVLKIKQHEHEASLCSLLLDTISSNVHWWPDTFRLVPCIFGANNHHRTATIQTRRHSRIKHLNTAKV